MIAPDGELADRLAGIEDAEQIGVCRQLDLSADIMLSAGWPAPDVFAHLLTRYDGVIPAVVSERVAAALIMSSGKGPTP